MDYVSTLFPEGQRKAKPEVDKQVPVHLGAEQRFVEQAGQESQISGGTLQVSAPELQVVQESKIDDVAVDVPIVPASILALRRLVVADVLVVVTRALPLPD